MGEDFSNNAWHDFVSLKNAFDKLAPSSGFIDITDMKALAVLANVLKLDLDIVKQEIKKIDSDSNGAVSFADCALWADRHTAGLPLGLESVPEKREWRKGIPAYWSSIPPDEPATKRAKKSGGAEPAGAPAPVQLALIDHRVAAYHGDVAVLRRLVEDCKADGGLLTRDAKTPIQAPLNEANSDAVNYLRSLDLPGGSSGAGTEEAQAHAVIDAARDGNWEVAFRLLREGPPGLVNMRPEVRKYGVLHQAAHHGCIQVLRQLIEDFNANVKQLTKDHETALDLARLQKHDAAATYLETCVPNINLDDGFVTYPDQQFVTLGDGELQTFRDLLLKTHKKAPFNGTRDREMASGTYVENTPVPTGYELVGVQRNENAALWRLYQISRERVRLDCKASTSFESWKPWTEEDLDWSYLGLCAEANEWLLLHGGIPQALSAIARTGFSMSKLGSGGTTGSGGLYGDGTYFGDSITKADEYARRKVEEEGAFKGCRTAALVRVLGGVHFYTDKDVTDEDKPNLAKRVLKGHYHSTVGDRLKLKNTYREYVAYDAASTYLEYILYYRRKGVPDNHM